MNFLSKFQLSPPPPGQVGFPFELQIWKDLRSMDFPNSVTFFAGENGTGKSTLLEALAIRTERIGIGGFDPRNDASLESVRPLAQALDLPSQAVRAPGFFLRAEDFFNFTRRQRELVDEMNEIAEKYDGTPAKGYLEAQGKAIQAPYGRDLDHRSHGEGFLDFFKARLRRPGLFLIDEPEAALSPQRQIAFGLLLKEASRLGAQLIIATHSPILLSFPGASIWQFDETGVCGSSFDQLEHVTLMRNFLEQPERFWRHL